MKVKDMRPQYSESQRKAAWEYAVVVGNDGDVRLLAEYGAEGWELVSVVRQFGERVVYYLKRRKS